MATEILCRPAGYDVAGGPERIAKALDAFHEATAAVANEADSLLDLFEDDLKESASEDLDDALVYLHDLIAFRNRAQEELLRAVAGRKAAA